MSAIEEYEAGEILLYGELTDFGLELFLLEFCATDENGEEIILSPVK